MRVMVERLARFGHPVHQVWLPPLPPALPLDALLGVPEADPEAGLRSPTWPFSGSLRFPVGVVDLPLAQSQQPLVVDLGRLHAHLALVGVPQSGKSTLLRTLALSGMLTHTPQELQFAALDFGGGGLHVLEGAPHTTGVAGRHEPERARRILAEARALVDERERLLRESRIGSIAEFRRRRAELDPALRTADLVLVLDNWAAIRAELEDADAVVLDLAARGPGAGVHLVLTANRWAEVRTNLRDAIGARLELRLGDSAESEVDRRLAKTVPAGLPGRGIAAPGHHFQAALPRVDGGTRAEGLADAVRAAVDALAAAWPGSPAPKVRLLPPHVSVRELAGLDERLPAAKHPGAVVGVGEGTLAPVRLDLAGGDQHLLVVGDGGAGKTGFLRTWMRGLADRHSPYELRFMVVDFRRGLADAVPDAYLGAYATDTRSATTYAEQLASALAERVPPPGLPPSRLADHDWWQGPDLYLVVDDYDLVASGRVSLLQGLLEFAGQSRELGFHMVIARRSGGISRTLMSDPFVSRLKELGTAGLLLSSDPREGILIGNRRGAELPPGRAWLVQRTGQQLVQVADDDRPLDEVAAPAASDDGGPAAPDDGPAGAQPVGLADAFDAAP